MKNSIIVLIGGLVVIAIMLCAFAACGNMDVVGIGNFNFEHIHFTDMTEGHCATVTSWIDNDNGIEVKTKEYGSIFLSEGSYILFESGDKCPYCD